MVVVVVVAFSTVVPNPTTHQPTLATTTTTTSSAQSSAVLSINHADRHATTLLSTNASTVNLFHAGAAKVKSMTRTHMFASTASNFVQRLLQTLVASLATTPHTTTAGGVNWDKYRKWSSWSRYAVSYLVVVTNRLIGMFSRGFTVLVWAWDEYSNWLVLYLPTNAATSCFGS